MISKLRTAYTLAFAIFLLNRPALAYEINDQLAVGGILSGAVQCQNLTDAPGFSNTCKGVVPLQPEMSFRPTISDEIFFKLGFASGNGLNEVTPFEVPPWAASLEDDVKNINGRSRDYLLTAWYKHRFTVADNDTLGVTIGIIDATEYLDENVYANDEFTQFMNAAFTNGPNIFLPSYDYGAAAEWETGVWSFSGVYMNIGENSDGNNTNFVGLQAGYHANNKLGAGNYRFTINATDEQFFNAAGTQLEQRSTVLLSFDQAFGNIIGGWIRFGRRLDDAAADYDAIYTGGIDIKGPAWQRHEDNIGLAYGYLSGGDQDINKTSIAEAYYRWQLGAMLGLTADIQYQHDDYKVGQGPRGWIYSLRATAEF